MNNRIFYLDFLKGISIFFVVLLHVSAIGLSNFPIGDFSWEICNIVDSFSRFVVPIFVMISGALLIEKAQKFNLYKSFKRLFIPLVLWSALYALVVNIYRYKGITSEFFIDFLKLTFITPTHNWFLFMLIGVYLLIPFIIAIVKSGNDKYFLILWFLFSVIIPFIRNFDFFIPLIKYVDRFSITMPLGYIGFFILGYRLHMKKIKMDKSQITILILSSIILTMFNVAGTHVMSVKLNRTSEIFYNYLSPIVVIYSVCVFVLFKILFANGNNCKLITLMSKYSLAIYMFHEFILIFIQKLGIDPSIANPILSIPFIAIVVYSISFIIIHIFSKINIFKKYMM